MNVYTPSLNIMFSARERNGQFMSIISAKTDLALIFNLVRADIGNKYLSGDITNSDQAIKYMETRVTSIMTAWYGHGLAKERTPSRWNGAPKTNLIYIFP